MPVQHAPVRLEVCGLSEGRARLEHEQDALLETPGQPCCNVRFNPRAARDDHDRGLPQRSGTPAGGGGGRAPDKANTGPSHRRLEPGQGLTQCAAILEIQENATEPF